MAGYGKSVQMVKVTGIKWTQGNKEWFLHLDKNEFVSWYGWLFVSSLGSNGFLAHKKASEKKLLTIISSLLGPIHQYQKSEIYI